MCIRDSCITAVLASIGTARNAKRTTIIHLLFNIIGTTIFTIVCILTPFAAFVESLTPDNVAAQIANMHTIFNITTTILLLPFGTYLAKIATKILPDLPEEKSDVMHLEYIRPCLLYTSFHSPFPLSLFLLDLSYHPTFLFRREQLYNLESFYFPIRKVYAKRTGRKLSYAFALFSYETASACSFKIENSFLTSKTDTTNAIKSAIGPASNTPKIPSHSGRIKISGIRKNTCLVKDSSNPLSARCV